MDNNGIGSRIKEFIRYLEMNMNSFSTSIGLPNNSAIVRIVNDPTRGVSLPLLQRIGTVYKKLDMNWLILGEGPMLKGDRALDPKTHSIQYFHGHNDKPVDRMRIHGYDDCDSAFDVFGDAMVPKFRPGDIVVCKSVPDQNTIMIGEAYLIVSKQTYILRYIKKVEGETYFLGAESARFNESSINTTEVDFLYLVKGVVRRETF